MLFLSCPFSRLCIWNFDTPKLYLICMSLHFCIFFLLQMQWFFFFVCFGSHLMHPILHTWFFQSYFQWSSKERMNKVTNRRRIWQWLYDLWLVFCEMDMFMLWQKCLIFMILLLIFSLCMFFLMVSKKKTQHFLYELIGRMVHFMPFPTKLHKNLFNFNLFYEFL